MPCMLEAGVCLGLVSNASVICYKEICVHLQVNLSSKVQHNASDLQRHQGNLRCSSRKLILLKLSEILAFRDINYSKRLGHQQTETGFI